MCALTAAPAGHSPLLLFLGPPYFLRYNNTKIRPINNHTVTFKYSNEEPHFSHFKSKTKNTKLSKEGMSKAKIGQKLGVLHQTLQGVFVNAKEKFVKEIKSATLVNTQMIRV